MYVADAAGASSGWRTLGTWMSTGKVNQPPQAASVSPSSGAGSSGTFTYTASDPDGASDIAYEEILINTAVSGDHACFLFQAGTSLWLANDAYSAWLGPVTLGPPGILQNSQCSVDAAASTIVNSGNNRILILSLTFKPAFAGAKANFMYAADSAGLV